MQDDTVRVCIDIPAGLADEETAARAKKLLVLDAVRSERMSWRAAARALGLSPSDFLDLAREHGIPVVRYDDVSDLREDLTTLDRVIRRPSGAG